MPDTHMDSFELTDSEKEYVLAHEADKKASLRDLFKTVLKRLTE